MLPPPAEDILILENLDKNEDDVLEENKEKSLD